MKANTPFRTNGAYDGTNKNHVPSYLTIRRDRADATDCERGAELERKRRRKSNMLRSDCFDFDHNQEREHQEIVVKINDNAGQSGLVLGWLMGPRRARRRR